MDTQTDMKWLLTVFDVAELTHRQPTAIRKAIRAKKLKASDPKAGPYLVTRQAVADWLGLKLEDVRSVYSSENPGDVEAANAA